MEIVPILGLFKIKKQLYSPKENKTYRLENYGKLWIGNLWIGFLHARKCLYPQMVITRNFQNIRSIISGNNAKQWETIIQMNTYYKNTSAKNGSSQRGKM